LFVLLFPCFQHSFPATNNEKQFFPSKKSTFFDFYPEQNVLIFLYYWPKPALVVLYVKGRREWKDNIYPRAGIKKR